MYVKYIVSPYFCRFLERKTEGTCILYLKTRVDGLTDQSVRVECRFSALVALRFYMSSGETFRCDEDTRNLRSQIYIPA
jgi:hypothetical protein